MDRFFNYFSIAFAWLVWYNFVGQEMVERMDWTQITTIVVAVLTLIGTIIGNRINANKNLRDTKDDILTEVRNKGERFIDKSTDEHKESNYAHAKLSDEHVQILNLLNAEKTEQAHRFDSFTDKQKDTKQKVEEIAEFLMDWEHLIQENSRLRVEVDVLTRQCAELTEQLHNSENEV